MADTDGNIQMFCEITGGNPADAGEYLEAHNNDLEAAIVAFIADKQEREEAGHASSSSAAAPRPEYTGPRTLDGRPAPECAPASHSSAAKKPPKKKGVATLSSLSGESSHGHDHDDEDDDTDDDHEEGKGPRDLFAGGEKSGLAVQDPAQGPSNARKVFKDIIEQAKANARRAQTNDDEDQPAPSGPASFRGVGHVLGGDGEESRTIPDPNAHNHPPRAEAPVEQRTLHLWIDGFSIDDGPLRRFDDPANAQDLAMIRSGRAPLHLMNVQEGQRVDVKLAQHKEPWHQLPRIYRPFGGQGRRLGSPVPGESTPALAPAVATSSSASASASASSTAAASVSVDASQPSVAIRFQMPDGSRQTSRFNLTHTIGDLYGFVRSAYPAARSTEFIVQSTFPTKEYSESSAQLNDIEAFKKGGMAVVKWQR